MMNLTNVLNRLRTARKAGASERRRRPGRRGSILILVVALLVMLALIGTAFISTSTTDRVAAFQHNNNTQADLVVEGLLAVIQSRVGGATISGHGTELSYRANTDQDPGSYPDPSKQYFVYDHWDGPGRDRTDPIVYFSGPSARLDEKDITNPLIKERQSKHRMDNIIGDAYLASRVPGTGAPTGTKQTGDDDRMVIDGDLDQEDPEPSFLFISGNPLAVPQYMQFESPWTGAKTNRDAQTAAVKPLGVTKLDHGGTMQWGDRSRIIPSWLDVPQPGKGTLRMPALVASNTATEPANRFIFLAADADGDGVADAALFRLPFGQINGLTYYAGIRVLDNCGAVNAAVAWQPDPYNYFPTNVDLQGMLQPPSVYDVGLGNRANTFPKLLEYRNGGASSGTAVYNDDRTQRADVPNFENGWHAYWMQAGRRLDNPGFWGPQETNRFWGLPLSESMAMANRFCLSNPTGGSSVIETSIAQTAWNAVRRQPFPPNMAFDQNDAAKQTWVKLFNYYTPRVSGDAPYPVPATASMRALLTARNAVSNFAPSQGEYDPNGMPGYRRVKTPTRIGDWTQDGSTGKARMLLTTGAATMGDQQTRDYDWCEMPWSTHPTKVNVNTATYGELLAAYWAVLSMGEGWGDRNEDAAGLKQFKPPVRDAATVTRLKRRHVLKLRAAIAAVNTLDLRDADDDVSSRNVNLGDDITATVYGTERQPYITEALVHLDHQATTSVPIYVAIELYNPYKQAIKLTNWQLGIRNSGDNSLTKMEGGDLSSFEVPAEGYLVLESHGPTQRPKDDASINMGGEPKLLEKLITVLGQGNNELVLLRPRRADGQLSAGTNPQLSKAEVFDPVPERPQTESTSDLTTLVPVDQVNFQGIKWPDPKGEFGMPAPAKPKNVRYRYARAVDPTSADTSAAWHYVYPGPYNSNNTVHQTGWIDPPEIRDPTASTPASREFHVKGWFGKYLDQHKTRLDDIVFSTTAPDPRLNSNKYVKNSDQSKTYNRKATYRTRLLQVAQEEAAGQFKDQTRFPYGFFGRNGDILQVTFIGPHRINYGGNRIELTSLTMDSVWGHNGQPNGMDNAGADGAKPTEMNDDQRAPNSPSGFPIENIGRFIPVDKPNSENDDFEYWGAATEGFPEDKIMQVTGAPNRVAFAMRLFDFLTVQSPQKDYLPDVDFDPYGVQDKLDPPTAPSPLKQAWDQQENPETTKRPRPVPNGPQVTKVKDANDGREDSAGVEGLININTAPWRVLATLPWYPSSHDELNTPGKGRERNIKIAKAIVEYRDGSRARGTGVQGPFRSIFDVMRIKEVQDVAAEVTRPNASQGDLSPRDGDDFVAGGFESKYNPLIRVSNMITVRSDSYTAYVVVQGWRDAGTDNPELVVQRRAAAIIDRTTLKPVPSSGNKAFDPNTMIMVPQN